MGEEGGGLPSASDIVVGQVGFRSPSSWLRPTGRPGGSWNQSTQISPPGEW